MSLFAELPTSHAMARGQWLHALPVIHGDKITPAASVEAIDYLRTRPKGCRGLTFFYCPRRCLEPGIEFSTATQKSVGEALIRCAKQTGFGGCFYVGTDMGFLEAAFAPIREAGIVIDGPCWFDGGELFPNPVDGAGRWTQAFAMLAAATGITDVFEQNRVSHRLMYNSARWILSALGISPSLAVVATCAKIDTGYGHNEREHGGFASCSRSHLWATHPGERTTARLREDLAKLPTTHHAYVTLSPDIGVELEKRLASIKARKNTHVFMYAGMRDSPDQPVRSLIPDLEAIEGMVRKYV